METDEEYELRRARIKQDDAERRAASFELILSAFDELRRNGYVPTAYSPQWRERAVKSEAHLADALGFIDQTVYANEDNGAAVRWTNAEVLELLSDIRGRLTHDHP